MNLVWKLLRQHISIPQFAGFAFANLFGMLIVLLGYQFYKDVSPVFTGDDSFMKSNYIIAEKKIGTGSTLSGRSNAFTKQDIDDIHAAHFATRIGAFTATQYTVTARMGISGTNILNSELFLESIPDDFVDAPKGTWHYKPGDHVVPVILPRSYIAMYNFGFAQSRSLPKISDGLVGMIDFDLFAQGANGNGSFKGKVIGFSSRVSSILVPQAFMDWSNQTFAPDKHPDPTRLILDPDDSKTEQMTSYFDRHGYEVEDDKLDAEKTTYFLRLMVTMVMVVGLVISVLSFYILMLSIYLLVQKNSSKLENLLLIGYSPHQVARPYQLLTIFLNLGVLVIALVGIFFIRVYYMGVISTLFPNIEGGTMLPSVCLGIGLLLLVSIFNIFAIHRKIAAIWKRKE
ncbi:hypothetical protein PRBRB14_13810 [Hallella multisaccharivorax DSM 17128]|uniref:ABC transporter permease n=1 Tax=Hallella multisaccharivorax DSM 17128 TaxID=688246 RepID=F8NBZ4_9BACT|nr:ABC transporter permease [Hallella multisaccharivorax]EGN56961.1 hypothetical protein Premu_1548 [Hallella multisaccharivorax DSM 17128]GJG30502.1 hypothetical protein PRBRB14_13810 [Hallella multisaccharivorax DSM 17128]